MKTTRRKYFVGNKKLKNVKMFEEFTNEEAEGSGWDKLEIIINDEFEQAEDVAIAAGEAASSDTESEEYQKAFDKAFGEYFEKHAAAGPLMKELKVTPENLYDEYNGMGPQ